jgi:glutathione S-transferase
MSELEPAILEVRRNREDNPDHAQAGAERFTTAAAAIEQALDGHQYLVGERFSVADLVCGAVLIFARSTSLTDDMPNINAYLERLEARPARQRATAIGT